MRAKKKATERLQAACSRFRSGTRASHPPLRVAFLTSAASGKKYPHVEFPLLGRNSLDGRLAYSATYTRKPARSWL